MNWLLPLRDSHHEGAHDAGWAMVSTHPQLLHRLLLREAEARRILTADLAEIAFETGYWPIQLASIDTPAVLTLVKNLPGEPRPLHLPAWYPPQQLIPSIHRRKYVMAPQVVFQQRAELFTVHWKFTLGGGGFVCTPPIQMTHIRYMLGLFDSVERATIDGTEVQP